MQGAEGKHCSEPQKTHATSELVIVVKNTGHTMCRLASSLVTVVVGRPKIDFLKQNSILGLMILFCKV